MAGDIMAVGTAEGTVAGMVTTKCCPSRVGHDAKRLMFLRW